MSDNKKYYYLKLKDNFYNTEDIKLLESMQNGYEYSSLYLKLCLLSLKGEGKLLYKNRIPYKPEMLSTITGHKREVIEFAIPIFQELEMLTILDNGTIFIDDIQNLVGHASTESERKADYRLRIKNQKLLGQDMGQCPLEKKKELEKEKELYKESFEKFWDLYDKKVCKDKCFDKWNRIDTALHDIIFNHIVEYKKSQPDKQYRKNPEVYINNKSWNDEIINHNNEKSNELSKEAIDRAWGE